MVSGASEGIDSRLSLVAFYDNFGFLEYHFQFEKESRAARTKSHPAEGSWGDNRSARRVLLKNTTVRHHQPRALRIAPVCEEPLAVRA